MIQDNWRNAVGIFQPFPMSQAFPRAQSYQSLGTVNPKYGDLPNIEVLNWLYYCTDAPGIKPGRYNK
jgi:hypothetical protein